MSEHSSAHSGLHRTLTDHFEFGGVMTFDRDLTYLSAGGKGFEHVSLDPDALLGRTPSEVFDPEVAAVVEAQFGRALDGEQSTSRLEFQGRVFDCWVAPRSDDDGDIVGGVLVTWDVTDAARSRAELQLVLSAVAELRVGLTIAEAGDGDRPLIFVNHGFLDLVGYTRAEVVGRDCRFLQGPDTDPETVAGMAEGLAGGDEVQVILLNYRKDGTTFWNRLSIYPVHAEGGAVTHFIGIQEDVTEHRKRGIQLERSERMRVLGQVAGGVAHDLRNVLMGAGGLLELVLQESRLDADARRDLMEAQQLLSRGTSVAGRLLSFAREGMVDHRPLELNHVLRDRARFFRRMLREDVVIRLDLPDEEMWIVGDEGQIDQLLLNLATNAEQAMREGGALELSVVQGREALRPFAARPDGTEGTTWLRLSIRDTGTGMDPEVLGQAFDPFFTTRKDEGGTGLGLSSVYGTVKKMGGMIALESEPGEGTAVHLALPRAEPPEAGDEPAVGYMSDVASGTRVLVVEDEQAVRSVCRRILERAGYTVDTVEDAAQARAWIEENHESLDLMITDAVIPHGSGPKLAEVLAEARPDVPVILMSGYADSAIRPEMVTSNLAFISKPFEVAELTRLVASVLE